MYIGTKILEHAEPKTRGEYNAYRGWEPPAGEDQDVPGYLVRYQDGYESWSPKDIFERSYLPVERNERLPSKVSVGPKMVDDFIKEIHVQTLGEKNTVVRAILRNGFEIIESSACVDPANYSEEIGAEICMERIKGKVWELLGFLVQTAFHGV